MREAERPSAIGIRQADGSGATRLRRAGNADRIKNWVREGGSIIAIGGASSFLTAKEMELSTVGEVAGGEGSGDAGKDAKDAKDAKDVKPDTTLSPTALPGPPLVSPTAAGGKKPESLPGTFVRATLDRTDWITYGYWARIWVLSGFSWPGNSKRLNGAVWVAVENVGRGKGHPVRRRPAVPGLSPGNGGAVQQCAAHGARQVRGEW